jgi:hypothetical protein
VGLAALICLPSIAVVIVIHRTSGPDLFDLVPKEQESDGYALLAWYDLERSHGDLKQGGVSAGRPARVLGYMVEGASTLRAGQRVNRFVLLPDAGNALHPAHRLGDQMIDVNLRPGASVLFTPGRLVWVWGTLRMSPGNPNGPVPLYGLDNARTEPCRESRYSKVFPTTE